MLVAHNFTGDCDKFVVASGPQVVVTCINGLLVSFCNSLFAKPEFG